MRFLWASQNAGIACHTEPEPFRDGIVGDSEGAGDKSFSLAGNVCGFVDVLALENVGWPVGNVLLMSEPMIQFMNQTGLPPA
jgi:hypothetical protein